MAIDLSKFQTTITKKLMADNKLAISFSIPTLEDFALNTALIVNGETYYLTRPAVIEKGGKDIFKYSLSLEADIYFLLRKRFLYLGSREASVYGNLEFFIDLIISNINETYPTWSKGDIEVTDSKTITFSSTDCRSFLNQLATEFDVEFDVTNKVITAKKEVGQLTGYTFEYGQGKGLYQLHRKNVDSKETVTRVYGFGSSRNLPADYGKSELSFSEGYVEDFSEFSEVIEDEYVNEDIYPRFTGAITSVVDDLTITVPSMDFNLNDQLNAGQEAKVVFRSGDMLGREFTYIKSSYNDTTKTFTLIEDTDESGTTFPNTVLKINVGDTLSFIDIIMPTAYVTAAELELKADTEAYLQENKSVRVVYDLIFDHRFLKANSIIPKPGDFVRVVDASFGIDRLIRISSTTQVQDNTLTNSFKATISDFVPISVQTRMTAKILDNTKKVEIVNSNNIELARKNTLKNRLLQDRLFDTDDFFDTDNIRPLSINTSMLSVGAKSQNFQLDNCTFKANYLSNKNRFVATEGTLKHLEVSGDAGMDWSIGAFDSSSLADSSFYYLYAKCSKITATGVWELSTSQITVDQTNDYYFLVGILYEVIDGFRQSSFTYGSTFINGRTVTTGIITSIDGQNYFDLDLSQIKMGGFDVNVSAADTTTLQNVVLKGTIVQNAGGNTAGIGVFRGDYSAVSPYYTDDEVTYGGSTWRYINAFPSSGNTPAENTYWTLKAAKGDDFTIDEQGLFADRPSPVSLPLNYSYFATDESLIYFVQAGTPQTWTSGTPFGKGDAGAPGVNGVWFDYRYATGATAPSVDSSLSPAGWTIDPPTTLDTSLWRIQSLKETEIDSLIDFDGEPFVDSDGEQFEAGFSSFSGVAYWSAPVDIRGVDGGDGLSVLIVYADDSIGTNQSLTAGSKEYVNYYEYVGTAPTLPISATFIKFIGDDGGSVYPIYATDSSGSNQTFNRTTEKYVTFYEAQTAPTLPVSGELFVKYIGDNGTDGDDGINGNYFEYQYAKNGSTTTPPTIVVSALNPTGWSTTPPAVGVLEYLWITKSIKNYAGTSLISNWTTPTRISGINGTDGTNGEDGTDGADGATGPSPVFQGDYSSSKTYYGTGTRVDIVKYSGSYYVARTDAGTFSNVVPTNTAYWNTFGATFDSVATDLLFASLAYIENLGVQNLKTSDTGKRIEVIGADNEIKVYNASNILRFLVDGDSNTIDLLNGMNLEISDSSDSLGRSVFIENYRIQAPSIRFNKGLTLSQASANSIYQDSVSGLPIYKDTAGTARGLVNSGLSASRVIGSEVWIFTNGLLTSITSV